MPVNDTTLNQAYPLVHVSNNLIDDVDKLKTAVTMIDGHVAGLNGAVAGKAPLASPIFTGTPQAPTPIAADNSTKLATTSFVKSAITALIGGASSAFDTLGEIATALNLKVALSGDQTITGLKTLRLGTATTIADYLALKPTDYAAGKPQMYFRKTSVATGYEIGLWDGIQNTGEINFSASALRLNGQMIIPSGDVIGQVSFFALSAAPTSWLKANGAAVSRTVYAGLFAKIGTLYGTGDGSTTFNLPDLRGEFIRGFDDSRGADAGRTLGSWQADDFKNHTHGGTVDINHSHQFGYSSAHAVAAAPGQQSIIWSIDQGLGSAFVGLNNSIPVKSVSITATGGTSTRPRNVALLACIRYQ